MLSGQAAAVVLADKGTVGDAEQRVMGLIHIGLAEMHVIGGDQRQLFGIGHVQQPILGGAFFRQAMALQFDIKPARKGGRQARQHSVRGIALAFQQQLIDRPARPPVRAISPSA